MRRVPFYRIVNGQIDYVCPRCFRVIPRDLYKSRDMCPHCDHPLNKSAKCLLKFYQLKDKDLFNLFHSK